MLSKSQEKSRNYFNELINNDSFLKVLNDFKIKWELDNFKTFEELQNSVSIISLIHEGRKVFSKFGINSNTTNWIIFRHCIEKKPLKKIHHLDLLFDIQDTIGLYDAVTFGGGTTVNEEDEALPIALKISPTASKRDLLSYIQKEYKNLIFPLQQFYLNEDLKLGKIRTKKKNITTRNNFIYKHKNKPYKEIQILVRNKFKGQLTEKQIPDIGAIGKIISLESKKRK